MSATDTIAQNIFNQAIAGTPNNAGVPVDLANLIVAQTKHETGGYTSNAFKNDNNAIGYKRYSSSEYQTGSGIRSSEGDPYGHYDAYQDSIEELIDWIYRRVDDGTFPSDLNTIRTPDQYASFLKSAGYYGDSQSNYSKALTRWFKTYGSTAASIGFGSLLVIGTIGLLFFRKH